VILGVPVLDTAFAILRRATGGKGLATADKDHLHHRLVRLGHGHRRSVWILWAWTALLSAFVLYPTYNEGRGDAIVPMGVGAAALVLLTLFRPGFRLQPARRLPPAATDPAASAGEASETPGAESPSDQSPAASSRSPANGAAADPPGSDRPVEPRPARTQA
jgi:UDP-GlcNAc:undecaprenyl-phosphate GlcNAc-1-phosphate transferase